MFGLLMVVLGVVLVGYLVVKKYYAPWSLFLVGVALIVVAMCISPDPLLKKSTNSFIFDIFEWFTNISKSTLGGLGLQIMLISGFAEYLDSIGVTDSFSNGGPKNKTSESEVSKVSTDNDDLSWLNDIL